MWWWIYRLWEVELFSCTLYAKMFKKFFFTLRTMSVGIIESVGGGTGTIKCFEKFAGIDLQR